MRKGLLSDPTPPTEAIPQQKQKSVLTKNKTSHITLTRQQIINAITVSFHTIPKTRIPTNPQMDRSEMTQNFSTRRYANTNKMTEQTTSQPLPPPPIQPPRQHQPRRHIHPFGWGPPAEPIVAHTHPTLQSTPRVVPTMRPPTEIDSGLLARLRRGREVALRAVGFDEIGDVVNARQLYMDALYLLVPACRHLDCGPTSNRKARLREKTKAQRLASVMLDRCEAFKGLDP